MSQGKAHFLIDPRRTRLRETLKPMAHLPARIPEERNRKLVEEKPQDFAREGTERRIHRPKDPDRKKRFFRGKDGEHTVKNGVARGLFDHPVNDGSPTRAGRKPDKKIVDEEHVTVPVGSDLDQDTGFQGFTGPEGTLHRPKKKPTGEERTPGDTIIHRIISRTRGGVEQVIAGIQRLQSVQNVFRNTQDNEDDPVMEWAGG